MLKDTLLRVVAGAAGTVALNVATYIDMAARGRSSSSAPSKMVEIVANKAGLPLSAQSKGSQDQTAQNRESGLGALLGYVNGLGVGVAYGLCVLSLMSFLCHLPESVLAYWQWLPVTFPLWHSK